MPPSPTPLRDREADRRWAMPSGPPAHGATTTEPHDDGGAGNGSGTPTEVRPGRNRRRASWWQKWTRTAHVYVSMVALLVVLFFGATGITLNHPEWDFGFDTTTSTVEGSLPAGSVSETGTPEYLVISEFLRDEHGVRGSVTDFGLTDTAGYISYRGPGYVADVSFDTEARTFELTTEQQGIIGVLNDLHKGRNTNGSWAWVIDAAGAFLVVIALTGLGLQLLLRKRRTASIVVAVAGGILVIAVAALTLG